MIHNNIQYLLTFNYWGPDFGNLIATGSYSHECSRAVSSSSQWFFLSFMQTCTSYHSSIPIFHRISNEQLPNVKNVSKNDIWKFFIGKKKHSLQFPSRIHWFFFKDYDLCTAAGHKLDILFMWFVLMYVALPRKSC